MKAILERLYQHDTLSRAEAHDLLLGIAGKTYNDAQKATDFQRDCVLTNAAFGIHTICQDKDIDTCLEEARAALLSGKALKTFEHFVTLNS